MNFCLGGFSATTPKNKSGDKTFVFVSEVSPTAYTHAKLRVWNHFLKVKHAV